MKLFGKMERRTDMMNSMSQKVGVDWGEIIADNPERVAEFRSAALICSQCQSEGECIGWQAAHESAEAAPEYCLNRERLADLRQG